MSWLNLERGSLGIVASLPYNVWEFYMSDRVQSPGGYRLQVFTTHKRQCCKDVTKQFFFLLYSYSHIFIMCLLYFFLNQIVRSKKIQSLFYTDLLPLLCKKHFCLLNAIVHPVCLILFHGDIEVWNSGGRIDSKHFTTFSIAILCFWTMDWHIRKLLINLSKSDKSHHST